MKQITEAITGIDGLQYVIILDENGDTHFSDSLIVEEGKQAMELFLHFLNFVNKLKIAGNNQFKNGVWEFSEFSISILTINSNILILSHKRSFDSQKLIKTVAHFFDEID